MLAASTHDQEVFSFYPDEQYCNGFEEVLSRYRELVPKLRLAGFLLTAFLFVSSLVIGYLLRVLLNTIFFFFLIGPTSFAPIIEMAITVVEQSGGQYHVLVIIADGQVILLICILILKSFSLSSITLQGSMSCSF